MCVVQGRPTLAGDIPNAETTSLVLEMCGIQRRPTINLWMRSYRKTHSIAGDLCSAEMAHSNYGWRSVRCWNDLSKAGNVCNAGTTRSKTGDAYSEGMTHSIAGDMFSAGPPALKMEMRVMPRWPILKFEIYVMQGRPTLWEWRSSWPSRTGSTPTSAMTRTSSKSS